MPRYFFDLYDHQTIIDDHGIELSDIGAASAEAVRLLADIAKEFMPKGATEQEFAVHVRRESGAIVLKASGVFKVELVAPE